MKTLSHSELWINTEYLIQAFRCVCSLTYLDEHSGICQFINAKDFIDGKLHRFYINICALVDIHCEYTVSNSKRSEYKKMLKTMYPSYDWAFYERDKNAAHKDVDYVFRSDISLLEIIKKMKRAVNTTMSVCANIISDKIELEYYAYDPLLFRYVNGITPELEKAFNESIYIKQQFDEKDCIIIQNISDARQVRNLDPNEHYGIVCTNGLMGQPYDMLEHRQDFCIRLNAWNGLDSWATMNKDDIDEMLDILFKMLDIIKKELM